MKTVSVIILNWNGRQYLDGCLCSVLAQTYDPFDVILVDNGSADGSAEWVAATFPQVRLIRNQTNRGFAAANNQAIQASRSDFVALLNNDTVVAENWLGRLVDAMQKAPDIGMCASTMLLAGRVGTIDSAGIAIDRAGIAWGLSGGQNLHALLPSREPEYVFGPSGGAALYRRSMLDEIGLFDEDFFAYLEDVDLAWRAQWAGWRCALVPNAVVVHTHSGTTQAMPHFKSRLLGRNKIWLLAKNYPFPYILWYWPLILAYECMSLAYAFFQRRLSSALRGRYQALGGIPVMLAKRRSVVRQVDAKTMIAMLEPPGGIMTVLRRYHHISAKQ